jgi:biotin operon repressor
LITLLRNPDASGSEIATELDVCRPTVSRYAAKLEEAGVLSRAQGYRIVDPETVLLLLVRYDDSFGEGAAELAQSAADLVAYTAEQ